MSVATERPAVAGLQAREELLSKLSPGPGKTAAEVAENQRVRIHRAMIDIVGERGYEAVTIRELAQVAGVSSRACYENFTSKEECFLRTHEGVGKRILRHVASAESHAGDAEGRLRLIFEAFAGELARDPRAARLFLVEPYVAGPEAVRQLRGAMRVLQSRVAASFVLSPGEGEFPEQVIEAVVAGAEGVARAMLCAGRERELASLGDSLEQWALRYRSAAAIDLADLDCRFVPRGSAMELSPVPSSGTQRAGGARSSAGDRALLLAALARLAATEEFRDITASRIREVAGLARRRFSVHFDSVEDCFLTALEARLRAALARAERAEVQSGVWPGGVSRAIGTICAEAAADPVFAGLCFGRASEAVEGGAVGADRRRRFLAEVATHVRSGVPAATRPGAFEVEASLEAAWALLRRHVADGRPGRPPEGVASVAYLVLAPLVGPEAAVAAIRDDLAPGTAANAGDRVPLETAA